MSGSMATGLPSLAPFLGQSLLGERVVELQQDLCSQDYLARTQSGCTHRIPRSYLEDARGLSGLRDALSQHAKAQLEHAYRQAMLEGQGAMRVDCMTTGSLYGFREPQVDREEQQKAEKKALLAFQNLYGAEACDIYRKDRVVMVQAEKFAWLIGNLFHNYMADSPFSSKPDVARIDNPKKLHLTYLCVDQRDREPTPYTDKVIAFVSHLKNDEKQFAKIGNRIKEGTLEKLPVCAVV